MDSGLAALLGGLLGALTGGGFSFLATWYQLKEQRKKDVWTEKVSRLEQADGALFQPFLMYAYRLDAGRDVNLSDLLEELRKARSCFTYCPKDLKQKFLELYSTLEKLVVERDGAWRKEDIDTIVPQVKQIEALIGDVLFGMEL